MVCRRSGDRNYRPAVRLPPPGRTYRAVPPIIRTHRCARRPLRPPAGAAIRCASIRAIYISGPAIPPCATLPRPMNFPIAADPAWRVRYARCHGRFDHRLLVDNLMHITHLPYAHKTTIGAGGGGRRRDGKDRTRRRTCPHHALYGKPCARTRACGSDGIHEQCGPLANHRIRPTRFCLAAGRVRPRRKIFCSTVTRYTLHVTRYT